jgi:anti-anti-sigma regulatory factor
MLRITYARTEIEQRWTLCGQLTGPWVGELRASWEYCRQVGVTTVVDLSDVTFIDESGEKLLSQMRDNGAEFVAAGVDTTHLLTHLKAEGERSLRRCIAPESRNGK